VRDFGRSEVSKLEYAILIFSNAHSVKTIQTLLLKKVRALQSCGASKA